MLIKIYGWYRGPKPLYFMKNPQYCLPPPPLFFIKFYPTPLPPPFPLLSNPYTHCCFFCLVSLAEWMIVPHLICCILLNDIRDLQMSSLVTQYQKNLDVCFMQQGIRFTEAWHIVWFFAGTLIWYSIHKHTHIQRHSTLRG